MRRTLTLCRSGLAAAAAVVLLTACGGDSSASDSTSSSSSSSAAETTENTAPQADSEFCTSAAAIQERITASFLGESDPSSFGDLFAQVAQEIEALEPPAELAADWAQFAQGVNEIATVSAGVDFTDQAASAQWQQDVAAIQTQYGAAFTNVQSYLTTECGLSDDEATETASPTT